MTSFDSFAPYYDLLYQDKNYAGDARFVHEQLGLREADILDLGCGTGRHIIELCKLGHRVHGVDSSADMIQIANNKGLSVECADVRTFNVGSGFHYDAVTALFHVASYQLTVADLTALFETARRHLKKGGLFICDVWYGPSVLTDPPRTRVKYAQNETHSLARIAHPTLCVMESQVEVRYALYVENRHTHAIAKLEETHRLRYWFMTEIMECLNAARLGDILSTYLSPAYNGIVVARCN